MEIVYLPTNSLVPDPNQPRQIIDHDYVADLSKSIITEGIINPIEVDENNTIITGEMRWRAATLANLKTIPCKRVSIHGAERYRRQVIENIHRNTMSDWDTAIALKKLLGDYPSVLKMAESIGRSPTWIADRLNILKMPSQISKKIEQGKLSVMHVRALIGVPPEHRKELERRILGGLSGHVAVALVKLLKSYPSKSKEILATDITGIGTKENLIKRMMPVVQSMSYKITKSYENVDKLTKVKDFLVVWLAQNPKNIIGKIHAPRIALTLSVIEEAINEWKNS